MLRAAFAISALVLIAVPVGAQAHLGIRAGLSVAPATRIPDVTAQVYVGGHLETEPMVGRLVFRPNVETGFGDELIVAAFNGDFVWRFPPAASGWSAYVGGGPTVSVFWFGSDRFGERKAETAVGVDFLAGFEYRSGLFFEVKLGVLDRRDIARSLLDGVEELKAGIGFTWR